MMKSTARKKTKSSVSIAFYSLVHIAYELHALFNVSNGLERTMACPCNSIMHFAPNFSANCTMLTVLCVCQQFDCLLSAMLPSVTIIS